MRKLYTLLTLLFLVIFAISCSPSPEPPPAGALTPAELVGPRGERTRTPPPPILTQTATIDATATLTPTATPVIAATATIGATVTPLPTFTPGPVVTATPLPGACPEHANAWHAPLNQPCMRHHHGINPRSQVVKDIFNIDGYDIEAFLLDPLGELWQPLWLSSPGEERNGFIWVLYEVEGCIQGQAPNSAFDFSQYNCITDVLVRHHDTGDLRHLVKMFHSEALVVRACVKGSSGEVTNVCGILQISGRNPHYGSMHASYKKVQCNLPGQPTNEQGSPPPLLQANYRTSRTQFSGDEFNVQYWVSVTTDGVLAQYYANTFNSTVTNFAWSGEGWQFWPAVPGDPKTPDVSFCGTDESLADIQDRLMEQPAVPGVEHRVFQLVDLRITLPEGWGSEPVYWFDVYGNPLPEGTCEVASGFCVPWYKTPHFPGPKVAVNYDAINLGKCDLIPCFIADDNGVVLVPPWLDVP